MGTTPRAQVDIPTVDSWVGGVAGARRFFGLLAPAAIDLCRVQRAHDCPRSPVAMRPENGVLRIVGCQVKSRALGRGNATDVGRVR